MKIFRFASHWVGGRKFLFVLLFFIFFISCQNRSVIYNKINGYTITENHNFILVKARLYSLSIDKTNAVVSMKNNEDVDYCSFPLSVQFAGINSVDTLSCKYEWKLKSKTIHMNKVVGDSLIQKYKILCFDNHFVIEIASIIPDRVRDGVFLFKNIDQGFDTANWEQYFSPEPDNYFSTTPTVDVRVDLDQQWKFTPAPLNLSFLTSAGWFSTGLTELADASLFSFRQNALFLNYPWNKLSPENNLFNFPPLVFTFNENPWESIQDFRKIVFKTNKHLARKEKDQLWWRQPILSAKGEQIIQNITGTDSLYNSDWIKDYFNKQKKQFKNINFTFILEDKWSQFYGDPAPNKRFENLRKMIDWIHENGSKVILTWKAWKVEHNSLAINLRLNDGEHIDATHPNFDSYVDSCCKILLGSGKNQLNADGLQINDLFLVRDPNSAHYSDVSKGIGFKEVFLYLESFYRHAKKYKLDALILSTAIDPHFSTIQDMVRINDDWDNKLRREKRARIITQALPNMLICGDAAAMYNKIAPYHYAISSIYGIPAIHYLNDFQDGAISAENKTCISKILKLSEQKQQGILRFVDYGNWQIIDKNENVLAESTPKGDGILFFTSTKKANFLCVNNKNPHLIFDKYILLAVKDENGIKYPFKDLGQGIYKLTNLKKGEEYQLNFIRRGTFQP